MQEINKKLPFGKEIKLKFSNGWLHNFQKRNKLRALKCYGESGDADLHAVRREILHLRNSVGRYKLSDVFNADEFGHFYNAAPDRTILSERMAERKKNKTMPTYLACCNGDGTEKFTLFVIGKSAKPRCFKKKSGEEHGFDYANNKRACMTAALFTQWLMRFSDYVTRSDSSRRVLLLIDNCSAHGSKNSLPDFPNVEILFLPPNTTSKLQPLDAGIIASLKVRYRSMQYESALDRTEIGAKDIYSVLMLLSCFFRLVLDKVASRFGTSRPPRLRSLCRLESVDLRRIIIGYQRLSYYHGKIIAALQIPNTDPDRTQNVRSTCEQLTMFVTHPSIIGMRKSIDSISKGSKNMFRKREWNGACSNKPRQVPETRGGLLPPVLRLQNRHHKLLGVRWYFGEFPPQPTLVRERLESRGYMVDRLRELMLLGQLSPVQKLELSMVLDTISHIVMNM